MTELISAATRELFRDLMADSTHGQISAAFQHEGFAPNLNTTWEDGNVPRTVTQHYLQSISWADPHQVRRALRAFERLLSGWPDSPSLQQFHRSLRRDGYTIDTDGAINSPTATDRSHDHDSLATIAAPGTGPDQLYRTHQSDDDPAQVIASANQLIHNTAKFVLAELHRPINTRENVQSLATAAQDALLLRPASIAANRDGSDTVLKILDAAITLATSVTELNHIVETGHRHGERPIDLRSRHAKLAVNAAATWCELMLGTLADAENLPRRPET